MGEQKVVHRRRNGALARVSWCAFVCLILLSVDALDPPTARADQAGVCGTKDRRHAPVGTHVSFHGSVLSDGMHSTGVIPDACPNVLYALAPDRTDDGPAAVVRHAVMRVGEPGTVDKQVILDIDAVVVVMGDGIPDLRITMLRQMVLTYPTSDQPATPSL